jgi:hypothetical protein
MLGANMRRFYFLIGNLSLVLAALPKIMVASPVLDAVQAGDVRNQEPVQTRLSSDSFLDKATSNVRNSLLHTRAHSDDILERPRLKICKVDKDCVHNERCGEGQCVGSPCNLGKRPRGSPSGKQSPSETFQQLCPESQVCWTTPVFIDGDVASQQTVTWRTDSPGMCAHRDMKCNLKDGGKYGLCPSGWYCIKAPNGDGSPCGVGGDTQCSGLCMFTPSL